jgi:hypothetical protein
MALDGITGHDQLTRPRIYCGTPNRKKSHRTARSRHAGARSLLGRLGGWRPQVIDLLSRRKYTHHMLSQRES